MPATAGAP